MVVLGSKCRGRLPLAERTPFLSVPRSTFSFPCVLCTRTRSTFQGREDEVIVVSLARCGNGRLGFLEDDRRINVMATRWDGGVG